MPYIIAVVRTIGKHVEATILGPGFSPLGRAFSFASQYEAEMFVQCMNYAFIQGFSAGERASGWEPQRSDMPFRHSESFLQGRNFRQSEPLSLLPDQMENKRLAEMAFSFWEDRGCPFGSPDEDWFRAERELRRTAEKFIEEPA
jgi:hypothetical protein